MNKKSYLILLVLLFCGVYSFAQQEASYWYFGQYAGLRFDAGTGTVAAITDGQLGTLEGCTTISDTSGNLKFYTDGRTVWNRNHDIMANGDYFAGKGLLGDPSSTSSGLIVPKPQDPTKYYIFTVDEPHHNNASVFPNQFTGIYDSGGSIPEIDDGYNNGFAYSLVDINLDGGLGDVVDSEKNVSLVTYDVTNPLEQAYKCSEKITAVKADDCSSFWVITHFTNAFYAFKVDDDGVDTDPIISVVGPEVPISGYRRNSLGYLKASPDGSKLAVAHFGFAQTTSGNAGGGVYLLDFDNDTGVVSNSVELYSPNLNDSPYGVEFSSENRKLYATINSGISGDGASSIFQWDLESTDIPNSINTIHQSGTLSAGALQLGIDKRIYRAQVSFTDVPNSGRYLGIINNPEENAGATNYNESGILLDINGGFQNLSRIGLPPFVQSLFNSQIDIIKNGVSSTELNLCSGETFTLTTENSPGSVYTWLKDGIVLTETIDGLNLLDTAFELEINETGLYEVFIELNNGDCPIEGEAYINVFDIPTATQPSNLVNCDLTEMSTFDLSSQTLQILDAQNPLNFTVRYFLLPGDADTNSNEIAGDYTTTTNSQTIYARVENNDNPNCYVTTSFTLTVFITPVLTELDDIFVCDTDFNANSSDGITTLKLNNLKAGLLGTQEPSLYTISFHPSLQDAENDIGSFDNVFTNTTPYSEPIFVRIENKINTDCFSTGSFNLAVTDAPEANDASLVQCDEDGIVDGLTMFDLNQAFDDITDGATNRKIQFYNSPTDLENEVDELNADNYENYANPQTVYVLVTNTDTGCTNTAELSLQVSSTSSNNTTITVCDDDGTEDGLYTFNLNDTLDAVLVGLSPDLDVVFYETYIDALIEDNPLGNTFTNTSAYNQTIFARVENSNACFGISTIELTVFELPNIVIQEDLYYCLNTFPTTITLNGGLLEDIPNNYDYDWSTGEDEFEIQVNEPGIYTVRVTSTDGCFKDRSITVLPSDIASFVNIEVTDGTSNNMISVVVTGEGVYEYALDNPAGPYQERPIFENVRFGFHTVYVRDIENNCGIVNEVVSVIGFPKYFTPNGDSFNPRWQIKGVSNTVQPNSQVLIFDRFGKLLAEIDPLGPGWDGTFNGFDMPSNDYWFVITLEDGRVFKSHFTLKR